MNMYKAYQRNVRSLKDLGRKALSNAKLVDSFSKITRETNWLREIMDVQDELSIVEQVLATQKSTLESLAEDVPGSNGSKTPSNSRDRGSRGSFDNLSQTALLDASCVKQAIRIVEENLKSTREMMSSANRVQGDVKSQAQYEPGLQGLLTQSSSSNFLISSSNKQTPSRLVSPERWRNKARNRTKQVSPPLSKINIGLGPY